MVTAPADPKTLIDFDPTPALTLKSSSCPGLFLIYGFTKFLFSLLPRRCARVRLLAHPQTQQRKRAISHLVFLGGGEDGGFQKALLQGPCQ